MKTETMNRLCEKMVLMRQCIMHKAIGICLGKFLGKQPQCFPTP